MAYWWVVLVSLQEKGREEDDRMEVIGSEQRQEDPLFFKLHWEEETARRWELKEVATARQEQTKPKTKTRAPSSHWGVLEDER